MRYYCNECGTYDTNRHCKVCGNARVADPATIAPATEHERILEQRGRVYGDFTTSLATIGKIWTALIEAHYQIKLGHDIPPHITSLMMVGLKVYRASCPFDPSPDSYPDARNYLDAAEKADPRLNKHKEGK